MKNNGKDYENLIATLYKHLAPNAILTPNDSIIGRNSEVKRQIDLSIRYNYANVEHLIIIEVKDYNKPVNVKTIEGFASVIKDVGANKGILISARGFSKAAQNFGKNLGIECLTVHSAENKNWEKEIQILVVREEDLFDFSYKLGFNAKLKGSSVKMPLIPIFSFDQGKTVKRIGELIQEFLISKRAKKEVYSGKQIVLNIPGDIWFYHFGNWIKLANLEIITAHVGSAKFYRFYTPEKYTYTVDHIKKQMSLHGSKFQDLEYDIDETQWQRFSKTEDLPIVIENQTHIWQFLKFTDGMFHVRFGVDNLDSRNEISVDLGLNKYNEQIMEEYLKKDGGLQI
ncbi:restriction endonuclease [Sphingobacterium multivorum]|uniref:restriction endonuclease n=1 Tax=Sphingobacterium multivorum TaxID=28454 RepID=UPI0031B9B98C